MKLLMIANRIYLPLSGTNKYMAGSVSGQLFINEIHTLEEIKEKHKEVYAKTDKGIVQYPLTEHENLHDLCKAWGTR